MIAIIDLSRPISSSAVALEQCNYSDHITIFSWSDPAYVGGLYTVAVWYRKGYKIRDMKPSDWEKIEYPNNINA